MGIRMEMGVGRKGRCKSRDDLLPMLSKFVRTFAHDRDG